VLAVPCASGYSVPAVPARDFFTIAKGLRAILEQTRCTKRLQIGKFHMKAERKKTHQSQQRERLWHTSLRAEDAAVAYLHEFTPAVAFATACSVERTLAVEWRRSKRKCAADAIRVRSWK
jgi:hypothetical protein